MIDLRIRQPATALLLIGLIILLRLFERVLAPRIVIVRLCGPHKRALELDGHLLDGAGPEPALYGGADAVRRALLHALLVDVGAHGDDADRVGVVEVVAHVELVHAEGHYEASEGWGHAF